MVDIMARAHLQTLEDAVQVGLVLNDAFKKMHILKSFPLPQRMEERYMQRTCLPKKEYHTMEARVLILALAFVNDHTQIQAATIGPCVRIWKLLEMGMLCAELTMLI